MDNIKLPPLINTAETTGGLEPCALAESDLQPTASNTATTAKLLMKIRRTKITPAHTYSNSLNNSKLPPLPNSTVAEPMTSSALQPLGFRSENHPTVSSAANPKLNLFELGKSQNVNTFSPADSAATLAVSAQRCRISAIDTVYPILPDIAADCTGQPVSSSSQESDHSSSNDTNVYGEKNDTRKSNRLSRLASYARKTRSRFENKLHTIKSAVSKASASASASATSHMTDLKSHISKVGSRVKDKLRAVDIASTKRKVYSLLYDDSKTVSKNRGRGRWHSEEYSNSKRSSQGRNSLQTPKYMADNPFIVDKPVSMPLPNIGPQEEEKVEKRKKKMKRRSLTDSAAIFFG